MKDSAINMSKIQNYMIYFFLIIALWVFISQTYNNFHEKSEYRGLYHGDLFSEIGTYAAGLNFVKWGFANLYFLPIFTFKDTPDISKEELYTHYAPGADLMSGILIKTGISNLYTQKFILLLISTIAILVCSISFKYIIDDKKYPWMPASLFLSLALTSPWFVYRADTIHINSYGDILLFFGIWAIVSGRISLFILICFLSMLFTFETIPFLFVMAFFKTLREISSKQWTKIQGFYFLSLVICAFVFSFIVHFSQVAWMYGSVNLAFNEFLKAFCHRTGTGGLSDYYFSKHISKALYSTLWFYGSSVLFLAIYGLIKRFKEINKWIYALLIAGVSWQFLLRQHGMVHASTMRLLGVGIFALAIIGFSELFYSGKYWLKITACALLCISLLRIPLGAEVSKNKLLLNTFTKVISKTDSVVIANLLYFTRESFEHREEKCILINELAKREGIKTDLDVYEFILDDKIFLLEKLPRGYLFSNRNIPIELTPKLSDSEVSAYQAVIHFPAYNEKQQIIAKGKNNVVIYILLKVYILLI